MKTDKNLKIYKSSAGSGKTTTLVQIYLTLALKDNSLYFRHILAITFTNKAADEMKERIIRTLIELSEPSQYPNTWANKVFIKNIAKNIEEENEIRKKAKTLLHSILHKYDYFAVKTIDSFISDIVRIFTKDLQLPDNFDIELDYENLLENAINNVVGEVGIDNDLTKLLIDFMMKTMEDEKRWSLKFKLKDVGKLLFNENSAKNYDEIKAISPETLRQINKKIAVFNNNYINKIKEIAGRGLFLMNTNSLGIDDFAYGSRGGIGKFITENANGNITQPSKNVSNTLSKDDWSAGKASKDVKNDVNNVKPTLELIVNELIRELDGENFKNYNLYKNIISNSYQVGVLGHLCNELENIKNENNLIHISDMNRKIAKIISKEPAPFIYERIGETYKHFLIDEFQDTSELQWIEFIPLLSNSLSTGNESLIVGDAKQAIYRWRNGNVQQFKDLPELPVNESFANFKNEENSFKEQSVIEVLNKNYRSKKEIIDFNNSFYKWISDSSDDLIKKVYSDVEQQYGSEQYGGYVEIDFAPENKEDKTNDYYLNRLKEIINDAVARGNKYEDIAVIARENASCKEVVSFLLENGVPVVSSVALSISQSKKVCFINHFIKYLVEPEDQVNTAAILKYLNEENKIAGDFIELFNNTKKNSLIKALKDNGLAVSKNDLLMLPLIDLVEEIIRIFNLNTAPDPFINAYRDFVLQLSVKNQQNILNLISEWENQKYKLQIPLPENMNAVQVLTIHKVKGMEFNIAIWYNAVSTKGSASNSHHWKKHKDYNIDDEKLMLLSINKSLKDTDYSDIYDEEDRLSLLEFINLMYVATTRAKNELYILTKKLAKTDGAESYAKYFNSFVNSNSDDWQNEEGCNYFSKGEKINLEQKEISQNTGCEEVTNSVSWNKKLVIAPNNTNKHLDSRSEKLWGIIVHQAIAKANLYEDINEVSSSYGNIIDDKQKSEIIEKINNFRNLPEIQKFTQENWQVMTENTILVAGGDTFRPDMILMKDKNVAIIEFKTGKQKPKDIQQLEKYAELLTEMNYNVDFKKVIYL